MKTLLPNLFAGILLSLSISSLSLAEVIDPAKAFDASKLPEAKALEKILNTPENEIDLAKIKLTLDKMVEQSIDVNANLKRVNNMAEAIQATLPDNASSMQKMLTIKKYLYEAGAWNHGKAYQYDFKDPKGTLITNKLIPTYLNTKQGNCVSMPLLFIILGQKLGIDVTASTAPRHVLVKFTETETGTTYNLETTSGANFARDVWYQQQMGVTDIAIRNKAYLHKLSKTQTVAIMATVLAENYFGNQEYEKAMIITDTLLKYNQRDIGLILMKGAISYRLLAKHYLKKYPRPNLIPEEERPYFEYLSKNNHYWFQKAESLGWREPSQQDEQRYLETVKKDGTMPINN